MSVEIWPPISPEELKIVSQTAQKRELDWLVGELHETLINLKHGLEDCYALLAPIDPGSTLVLSTPRNEIVKGTVTRVGTRIVKGTIYLRLRTLPAQTITLNPEHPIHLAPLTSLQTLLNHSLDLLSLTLSYCYLGKVPSSSSSTATTKHSSPPVSSPHFLAAQLRLLSQSLTEASSLLKGPPLTTADPSWTTRSVSPSHFLPAPSLSASSIHHHLHHHQAPGTNAPPLSFHLGIQDSSLVLWLRSLEAASAPVNFGTKLALAIGTTRRLEHDEAERVFGFCCGNDSDTNDAEGNADPPTPTGGEPGLARVHSADNAAHLRRRGGKEVEVFVREKVRVESADPSLMSMAAKLTALGHVLSVARKNLAAVMGDENQLED